MRPLTVLLVMLLLVGCTAPKASSPLPTEGARSPLSPREMQSPLSPGETQSPLPTGASPVPGAARIVVRRTGGIAGFDHELTVGEDGAAYLLDRRTGQSAHFQVSPAEVQEAVEALRPFLNQGEVGTPFPDMFVYTITVREGEKTWTVTFYVGEVSDQVLRALQPIQEWFERGLGRPPVGTPRPALGPVEAARRALAEKLGIPIEEVTAVSSEAVYWPDTSLGCPQPGMMYAQVITPGYRITLEAQGKRYEAHTNRDGSRVVFCSIP